MKFREFKRCPKCGVTQSVLNFNIDRTKRDGLQRLCRKCDNKRTRKHREERPEVGRANYEKNKGKDLSRRIVSAGKWADANREKVKVSKKLRRAVKSGRIDKPLTCEVCGAEGVNILGHHEDYSFPLVPVWLCKPCHHRVHAGKTRLAEITRLEVKKIFFDRRSK